MQWKTMLGLLCALIMLGATPALTADDPTRPPAYTMRECVEMAIERSPRILAAEEAARKAEAEIGVARAGFFPKLSGVGSRKKITGLDSTGASNSDYDDQVVDSYGLQLTQTLFAGLTVLNGYQRAVLAHQYALAEKEEAVSRLILDVQTAFLDRQRAVEEARIHAAHLESLEMNGKALAAMFGQHLVSYSDVLEVEVEIANARQTLSETESFIATKTIELKGLMRIPFTNKIDFVPNAWDVGYAPELTLEDIRCEALTTSPAVRLAKLAIEVVQKDRDVAKGAFLPRLNLSLGYNNIDVDYRLPSETAYGDYDRDYSTLYTVGQLSLEWDLFAGGRDYYQVRRMKHEISRLQHNLRDQESLIYTAIEKAHTSFEDSRNRAAHALAFLKSARENVAMATARLDKSLGTLPELIMAKSQLQNAESNLVKTQVDCQQALANLYHAMGRRTFSLQ